VKVRVVVPVYNEEAMLPAFLRHYEAVADSIVVWDNGSTDATREIAAAHPLVDLRAFETDAYDELSVLRVLSQTKVESLGKFDWCLFPDCDEILAARDGSPLRPLLEGAIGDVVLPTGYNLIQAPEEPALDLGRPLLGQRAFGRRSYIYCKPIIMRTEADVQFVPGKHRVSIGYVETRKDPRIVLLHYEMADFDLWVYRKTRRPLSAENVRNEWCVDRFCRNPEFYEAHWKVKLTEGRDLAEEVPVLGRGE
jgi:glycosyltransferase involved in cell wall biosynthesis